MSHTDQLQRFSFDNTDIRGEIAHLETAYQEVIRRHNYPPLIAGVVGQLMAATALLSANLKFAGRLTLQMRMQGNITLLQAETNDKGQLRAIARYDESATAADLNFTDGSLVITMEPEQGQRYQGITAIAGGNIASALEDYFAQSEQLPSQFWLAADGQRFATGLMLQKLPTAAGQEADPDAWNRVNHLAGTVKEEELLQLPAATLLHRLFHEEQTRIYPASALSFFCTCSKPRIAAAIAQLGQDELNAMLQEQNKIDITCEFCQQHYSFDQAQVDALFSPQPLH